VLREAVQQQDRFAAAGLGHMHAQPRKVDEAVLHPVEPGKRSRWARCVGGVGHGGTILCP
jgi:hypothetical protein